MNLIENNPYTAGWRQIAARLPKPKAILSISAHWYTRGNFISISEHPETIYDFYGFPDELYQMSYPASGSPLLAKRVQELCDTVRPVEHGLDHGTWCVLHSMYPDADIPVVQLSVDGTAGPEEAFLLGRKLSALREEGILLLGSGNVVHNLRLVDFNKPNGFAWAEEFDAYIQHAIRERCFQDVLHYTQAGECARFAFPTPDHFMPLCDILGAADPQEPADILLSDCVMGALSMTSYVFG